MIEIDWSDVRPRVAALAARPGLDRAFGWRWHEGLLEPPLTAAELADLEAQLGIELPGEYRSFLRDVSRGGAGPAYGLFPLRRTDDGWKWEGDGADLTDQGTLASPFPHTEAFNPADGLPERPDEEADGQEAEDAWWELHDRVAFDPAHAVGLIYLCHQGCALREALVVSGPSRGQMWADDRADDEGLSPILDDAGKPLSFAGWYRRWLTESEQQLT
ncbi:SMI1/KNR4 family protein [Actinoplanes sp. NPDC023936]|uniref:SMI1/KNR4 family protein n=1 Tax=Actinoplanes sp. NPDC023936 TaxID=3154910 RepID=UPI0033FA5FC4